MSTPDFLFNVNANQAKVVIGIVLMAIFHTFLNIGLPVILLPILEPYNKYLAYGYLCAAIVASVILAMGAVILLFLIPLSEEYIKASVAVMPNIEIMSILIKKGSFFSYHMGLALWSLGGLMFVSILFISKLIPRLMSIWGIFGYLLLLLGSISELYEHNDIIEIGSVILGGLFEIALSIRLIVKGFDSPEFIPTQVKLK